MSEYEDVVPLTYPYTWSQGSELSLEDFLNRYRPSMVQNDGTKPWIWVRGPEPPTEDAKVDKANKEASILLKEVTDKVEAIKNDPTIPTRSNKKTGAKSKKEMREQEQSEATEKLTEIAIRNGYVSGKWLIFASREKVDMIWSNIASSLVSGPLAETPAFLAKVATSPAEESPNNQHLICIYMPDVYERDSVTEVMKVLLRCHGVNLSGVKSDMYTTIGLYSKHASGIPSTIWKSSDLLSKAEAKELQDKFFADIASNSKFKVDQDRGHVESTVNDNGPGTQTKPKPKRKKKDDDPFASDDNADVGEETQRKEEIQSKKAATKIKRQDIDDEENEPKNKKSRKL